MDPMNRETITNVWNAYKQVVNGEEAPAQELEESKLDPVKDKAVKKDFDDRKDKDIDNDGDIDSSDEYLHKRRKAISKNIKEKKGYKYEDSDKDEDDDSSSDDADDETVVKKKEKKGDKEYKNDEDVVEAKNDSMKTKFNKAFWWDKKITNPEKMRARVRGMTDDQLRLLDGEKETPGKGTPRDLQVKLINNEMKKRGLKEGVEEETESLDGIIETNRLGMRDAIMSVWEGKTYAERTKGATSKEELLSKESPKSKEFVDKHTVNDEDRGMEKGREDVSKNGGPSMQQAPVRRGDQRDNGDKKPVR